jgi:hypothetical protein
MFQTDDDYTYTPLREEQFLGDPSAGDFDMGAGVSSSQLQNPNVSLSGRQKPTTGAPGLGMYTFAFAIVLLVVVKIVAERAGNAEEFRTVRVGLENFFVVGTMAALWFFAIKMVAYLTKWNPLVQFAGFI